MNATLQAIAKAPVMINVYPEISKVISRFIQILHEEGYPAIEILARPFEKAVDMVKTINDSPQRNLILMGIGTILTKASAKAAVELKPDFIVSPAFSRKVLDVAADANIPYIPGVCTIQDIQDVFDAYEDHNLNVKLLKLCPVGILGYDYVKILGGMFPGITYCPTGTVTLETLAEWKNIACVGPAMESSFVPQDWLVQQMWDDVRNRLKQIKEITAKSTA